MTHIHHTITGAAYEVKRKGGRNSLPAEVKRNRPVTVYTDPAGEARFLEAQARSGMSKSAFGELILSVGLDSYLNQETV